MIIMYFNHDNVSRICFNDPYKKLWVINSYEVLALCHYQMLYNELLLLL